MHFDIPEGTSFISDTVPVDDEEYDEEYEEEYGETCSSWTAWGVDKTTVTSVTIPSSVTTLGSNAFRGCTLLRSVDIPTSVTNIKEYAFADCSALTRVEIPTSVTSIEESAFRGCSSFFASEHNWHYSHCPRDGMEWHHLQHRLPISYRGNDVIQR